MGISGLLLAWKSELNIQPKTQKSTSIERSSLLPIQQLVGIAKNHIALKGLDPEIDRLDYRPSKGIAKIRFNTHFTELQIDSYTGEILSEKIRAHDIIEQIHDGSILDTLFKNDYTFSKQIYSTITSIGLIVLSISGFILWYNPKRIRARKR